MQYRPSSGERSGKRNTNAQPFAAGANGGRVLGYDPDPTNKSSLVINQEEAAVVNAAFRLYLQTGSLKDTASALNERGYRTKSYTSRREQVHPGKPFSLTAVQGLLKNRAFVAIKEIGKRNKRSVEVVPRRVASHRPAGDLRRGATAHGGEWAAAP